MNACKTPAGVNMNHSDALEVIGLPAIKEFKEPLDTKPATPIPCRLKLRSRMRNWGCMATVVSAAGWSGSLAGLLIKRCCGKCPTKRIEFKQRHAPGGGHDPRPGDHRSRAPIPQRPAHHSGTRARSPTPGVAGDNPSAGWKMTEFCIVKRASRLSLSQHRRQPSQEQVALGIRQPEASRACSCCADIPSPRPQPRAGVNNPAQAQPGETADCRMGKPGGRRATVGAATSSQVERCGWVPPTRCFGAGCAWAGASYDAGNHGGAGGSPADGCHRLLERCPACLRCHKPCCNHTSECCFESCRIHGGPGLVIGGNQQHRRVALQREQLGLRSLRPLCQPPGHQVRNQQIRLGQQCTRPAGVLARPAFQRTTQKESESRFVARVTARLQERS